MSLNRQAAFNAAVKGIWGQQAFSLHAEYNCAYRDPHKPGVKCAVGHLIPNRNYRVSLEGRAASAYSVLEAISTRFGKDFDWPDENFLIEMQTDIHDNVALATDSHKWSKTRFRKAVDRFAKRHYLTNPLKEIA